MAVKTIAELEAMKAKAQANIDTYLGDGVRPTSHSISGESYNYAGFIAEQMKIVAWCDEQIALLQDGDEEFVAHGYT